MPDKPADQSTRQIIHQHPLAYLLRLEFRAGRTADGRPDEKSQGPAQCDSRTGHEP